jgi:nucleotide-binding universal stress UspA family protein
MEKLKALVPLDGTERNIHALNWLKRFFSKANTEITLINVMEMVVTNEMVISNEFEYLGEESELILDEAIKQLQGYSVDKFTTYGYAADEILKKAKKESYDVIIMIKSNKKGLTRMVGSVTSKVVKNAGIPVIVMPE